MLQTSGRALLTDKESGVKTVKKAIFVYVSLVGCLADEFDFEVNIVVNQIIAEIFEKFSGAIADVPAGAVEVNAGFGCQLPIINFNFFGFQYRGRAEMGK